MRCGRREIPHSPQYCDSHQDALSADNAGVPNPQWPAVADLVLDLRISQDILQTVQDITPLLRTETLKELLIELFFLSAKPRTLSDLARAIDVDQTTVMREVNRLLETGVVVEERVGRSRTVAIDPTHPIATPLRRLVRLAYDTPDAGEGDRVGGFTPIHAERPERRPLPSSQRRS